MLQSMGLQRVGQDLVTKQPTLARRAFQRLHSLDDHAFSAVPTLSPSSWPCPPESVPTPLPSQPTYSPQCWPSRLQTSSPTVHGYSFVSFQHFCNTAGCIYRSAFLGTQQTQRPTHPLLLLNPEFCKGPLSLVVTPTLSGAPALSVLSLSHLVFFLCAHCWCLLQAPASPRGSAAACYGSPGTLWHHH